MELLRLLFGLSAITVTNSFRDRRADRCPLDNLQIEHGTYEIRSGTSIVQYKCDEGFIVYGAAKLYCIASSWTNLPPKCITNTCAGISVQEPLRVEKEYNGSVLRFSCAVMNILEGPEVIICDGTSWSDAVPKCTPAAPATQCNFEDAKLCGWVHHDDTDVEWRLQMGNTKTSRTGPEHDHTFGPTGNGRYMYFETSSPTRTGHKAILLSPLYPKSYSRRCFDFWYHLLASGDASTLQVYIKAESRTIDELTNAFSVDENKGEDWLNHTILVNYTAEPFQIIFVATRGSSFRSDIAIDDVMLYECPEHFPTTSTIKPTEISTTSLRKTTVKQPATSKKASVTILKTTTNSLPVNSTIETKPTLAPIINPNVPVQSPKRAVEDNSSNLIYILVGVGLVVAVTIVVGVGIYCCKRQNSGYTLQSNGAVNPLYSAMTNDEATVHFAHEHDLE